MKNNKIKDLMKYDRNPFVEFLKGKMFLRPKANTIIAKGESIVNAEGVVLRDNTLLGRRKMVDKSEFAKIYASEIGILYELSKTAINVFLHFIKIMDYDSRVIFNYSTNFQDIGYKSNSPVYNGILELLNHNIIACSNHNNIYWINPAIVCKGDRFSLYTEYVCNESWTPKYAQIAQEKEQGREYYEAISKDKLMEYKLKKANETDINEISGYNEHLAELKKNNINPNNVKYVYKVINERQPKQLNIEGGADPFPQD